MGKIFLTIFLIFSIACSSSPDLMNTVIDKQKEMDAQYQQAQAGTKTKSTESPKASETTKPKKNINNCNQYKGVGTKITVTECLEINYAENSHPKQTLNLWIPCKINECNKKLFPLIIHIHGGGFKQGSKLDKPAAHILEEGFALASINYRLLPEYQFPNYLHDAKAAIRWLRGNEKKFI